MNKHAVLSSTKTLEKKTSLDLESKIPRKKKSNVRGSDDEDTVARDKDGPLAIDTYATVPSPKTFDYSKDGCLPPPKYITVPKKAAEPFGERVPDIGDLLAFLVTDNEGEGNCFYEAICDSVSFLTEFPQYKNNHQSLRSEISAHARQNKHIARKLFDAFLGFDEITEWAGELLHESVKSLSNRVHGDRYYRKLCKNEEFLKDYNFPKKITQKKIRETLLSAFDEEENLFVRIVESYFVDEDIKEMGWQWWLNSIGKDQFWAGQTEIALFSHLFGAQLVVMKYKERLVKKKTLREVEFSFSFPLILTIEDDSIDYDQYCRTDKMSETVFLWVVDPKNPSEPMDPSTEGKHYIALNPSIVDTTKLASEDVLHMEHDT
jgi:hypothetical protein